jgi:dihydroxyacid dehydratase/phosphogluconate dehydratase
MIDNCVCFQDYIVELEVAHDEIKRLRKALATYACRCGDCECYKDEFVASCGRSAREALGLILNANSLPYAQEIAAKALEEEK